ncbi:trihelix transcription factor PTL-like [Andrographis paniculata]|uniref:trihelix transcription factor PTL-like n=1 Tax=Andrographis paniculata TaxID=175694 RepID=UPI0021E6F40A|nr:trihelix transcription factor PTL-like [Andrographis paniculata]
MEDQQYGMPDLRHFIAAGSFEFLTPPPDFLAAHRAAFAATPYTNMFPSGAAAADLIDFKMDGGATVRWPRQETLALLEIRSKLDSKFKEANQKGPLWEEISRIMLDEHGYQRSGKKCREKFENLYKYYKKTKEGKAGRQDGKHYRFFRQLEALYGGGGGGESSNNPYSSFLSKHMSTSSSMADQNHECYIDPKVSDTSIISLSNSLNSETTSSEHYNDLNVGVLDINDPAGHSSSSSLKKLRKERKKMMMKNFKTKIKTQIEEQMRHVMENQEAWMDKMMRTIETRERERVEREEEWRRQDAARIDREHRQWAKERSWIKTRDAALMEAVQKLTAQPPPQPQPPPHWPAAMELEHHRHGGYGFGDNSGANRWFP